MGVAGAGVEKSLRQAVGTHQVSAQVRHIDVGASIAHIRGGTRKDNLVTAHRDPVPERHLIAPREAVIEEHARAGKGLQHPDDVAGVGAPLGVVFVAD